MNNTIGETELKKSFARFFASFSLLYLLVALMLPRAKGGILLGFILFAAGTTALNYFYLKYFTGLRREESCGGPVRPPGPS
jgi:hypothetical protein